MSASANWRHCHRQGDERGSLPALPFAGQPAHRHCHWHGRSTGPDLGAGQRRLDQRTWPQRSAGLLLKSRSARGWSMSRRSTVKEVKAARQGRSSGQGLPACCPVMVVGSTPGGGFSLSFATVPRWSAARAGSLSTPAAASRSVCTLITSSRRGGGVTRDRSIALPGGGAARP